MLKRLDHVSIGVLDLEKARELFCEVLGGEPLPDEGDSKNEGFQWFTFLLGGKKVELVSTHNTGKSRAVIGPFQAGLSGEFFFSRRNSRKASLTDASSGNSFATSGSSKTMLVPSL